MARFVGIGNVTSVPGLSPQAVQVLDAIKTNVELLTNQRGETNGASSAIRKESISLTANSVPRQKMQRSGAVGSGFTVSEVSVASSADHNILVNDVNLLAQDHADLRAVVQALITQLKA